MLACPAELDLERYLRDDLEPATSGEIRAHLEACALCQTSVAELRADASLFADVGRVLAESSTLPGLAPDMVVSGVRLLREIGRGGMGSVWEAEQERPKRRVAFKIVRPGRTSPRALRRLEAEADALARIQHPGIAQVFAAGHFDVGQGAQPWFAMELVAGASLLEHCRGLDLRARVRLLAEVSEAVHHAHQKGVIHRDLKPMNVLVTAEGLAKVLDFGVARVSASDLDVGQAGGDVVGTPSAMSPEQAAGDLDIDVRTDVWSLGALAFTVLAGQLPHDVRGCSSADAIRIAAQAEPRSLRTLAPSLPIDLAAVADKAVQRAREWRYQSAAEFAADLRRWLAHEPVTARRATLAYQLRKLAQRHTAAGVGLLAVLATATAGGVATWRQARRAEAGETEARAQLGVARGMADFLQEVLIQASVAEQGGAPPTIDRAFEVALQRVDADLIAQPEVEAAVRHVLGEILMASQQFARAEVHLRRALELRVAAHGERHKQVAYVLAHLAQAVLGQGRTDEAEPLIARALAMRTELGPKHALILGGLFDRLGHTRYLQGRLAEAVAAAREAITVFGTLTDERSRRANVAILSGNLALFLFHQGELREAETLFRQTIAEERAVLGESAPQVASALANLAQLLQERGELVEAEANLRQARTIQAARYGADSEVVANTTRMLGGVLFDAGQRATGVALLQEALAALRATARPDPGRIAQAQENLAAMQEADGAHPEAEATARAALATCEANFAADHPLVGRVARRLGSILLASGRAADAEPHLARAAEVVAPPKLRAESQLLHGQCLLALRRPADAAKVLESAHASFTSLDADRGRRDATNALVAAHEALGDAAAAAAWRAR